MPEIYSFQTGRNQFVSTLLLLLLGIEEGLGLLGVTGYPYSGYWYTTPSLDFNLAMLWVYAELGQEIGESWVDRRSDLLRVKRVKGSRRRMEWNMLPAAVGISTVYQIPSTSEIPSLICAAMLS
ncbi:hypothetical protein HOY82DRAFT_614468 [Tuber indicum]|nr:hypothetical protein HOY82DRAFT_614468 [Tuber indicum]